MPCSVAMERHLAHLNPQQRRAVEATEGPLLVLAGAGTGKTRVITARIAHLLHHGTSPESILAVTFTNKAAREMRERVNAQAGPRAAPVTLCTFHSFCARLLRRHGERLGLAPRFTICDSSDQLAAVRAALRELRVAEAKLKPQAALSRISLWKNRMVSVEQALQQEGDETDELAARCYRRYQAHLQRSRVIDFDDMLLLALRLVQEHEDVLAALQQRFLYLMVDEYQDTNGPQYQLLRELAGERRNLCVVGDDDQSIYGWRGADVARILAFDQDFPGAGVVRLETNYRSTEEILEAANAVIRNNGTRHAKELRSAQGSGVPVCWLQLFDEQNEASFVVAELQLAVENKEASWGDFAILFRTQAQPRLFEAEMRRRQVPYTLVGSQSFFDRKEVRDVLAFLRLVENPDDETALLRVVNVPPRGVGKSTIDKVVAWATEQGIGAAEAFARSAEIGSLPPRAVQSVADLRAGLSSLRMKLDHGGSLTAVVEQLLERVGYRSEVERCYDDEATRSLRWNGVREVLDCAANYERSATRPTLTGFLEELALTANDDPTEEDEQQRDAVTLMTLHAAKGLEFPRVYLVGFEEGVLPHRRSAVEDSVEEERRLAYVGITRARRVLTVTWCEQRSRYGRLARCHPSRFWFEATDSVPPVDWRATGSEAPPPVAKARATKKRTAKKRY